MNVSRYSYKGLKSLPALSPASNLKLLRAYNCNLQSLPGNLFHYQLERAHLYGNKGESVLLFEWLLSRRYIAINRGRDKRLNRLETSSLDRNVGALISLLSL